MAYMFRPLRADEIECRVSTINSRGCSLLLYKDARCDQNILDETVDPMRWKRSHQLIGDRLYCTVEIWDIEKGQWIAKQDVGTESYTEKEKGQASDSFKRACFNWGIGRELYTAPFVWIPAGNVNLEDSNGKKITKDHFTLTEIKYDKDGNISALEIKNDKMDKVVYTYGKTRGQRADDRKTKTVATQTIDTVKMSAVTSALQRAGIPLEKVLAHFSIQSIGEMTEEMFWKTNEMINKYEKDKKTNGDTGNA